MNKILRIILVILIAIPSCKQPVSTPEQRLEEWKDARFGMFIHWGPVSIKGTEIGWSRGREIPIEEYDNLYKQFNPVNFNADEWVSIAKDAGMKYLVFTSKHHDGFCNWDTRYTDYNIMNSPFGRDVMAELAAACKKQNLPLCFYHSTCDWHHPDFPLTSPGGLVRRDTSNLDRYTEYFKNQSVEIIENYGPLLVMWYDVPQEFDSIRGQGVIDHIREVQPDIIVNNRSGARGDFDTPEQRLGVFQIDRPWETCMTIGRQWAWKPDDEVKSLEQCLHSLVRSAGSGGNLLLNVGPRPDGLIEPLQVERLREMGQWLKKYGHTIYGTRGGPFKPTDWGVSTRKGQTIYLHILKWHGDSPDIFLPGNSIEIKSCRTVDGGEVMIEKQENGYFLQVPAASVKPINTIVEIKIKGNAMDIEPVEVPSQSLSYNCEVRASSDPSPHWRGVSNVNNGDWVGHYWQPAANDSIPLVEIDLGESKKVSQAILYESGQAVNAFEIQYSSGDKWIPCHKGGTISNGEEINLQDVTSRMIRLVITESSGIPGIYEIILL